MVRSSDRTRLQWMVNTLCHNVQPKQYVRRNTARPTQPYVLFSGGNRDQGNRKLNEDDIPRGLDLRPDDFSWMTEQIMGVANLCCDGKIVSVLEGGYGELKEQGGKWIFDREVSERTAVIRPIALQ